MQHAMAAATVAKSDEKLKRLKIEEKKLKRAQKGEKSKRSKAAEKLSKKKYL